jgi:hypothetical protein
MGWIHLAPNKDQWRNVFSMLINVLVPQNTMNFLTSCSFQLLTTNHSASWSQPLTLPSLRPLCVARTVPRQVEPSIADLICSTSRHNTLRDCQQRDTVLAARFVATDATTNTKHRLSRRNECFYSQLFVLDLCTKWDQGSARQPCVFRKGCYHVLSFLL